MKNPRSVEHNIRPGDAKKMWVFRCFYCPVILSIAGACVPIEWLLERAGWNRYQGKWYCPNCSETLSLNAQKMAELPARTAINTA